MEKEPSYRKDNDNLVVDVKYTKRQVLPAVKLERKNITMTKPPDTVPCIVTVTEDETVETTGPATTTTTTTETTTTSTVGGSTSPLGEEEETTETTETTETSEQGVPETNGHTEELQETEKPGSRLTVQFAELPPKRTSENVMEFLEEQEKSLTEQFKALPTKARKTRSPSPSTLRQSVGLDHLDNLVRLMEQLAQLRDENTHLKKKCAYLESTKHLLQAKTSLGDEALPIGYSSLPSKAKPKLRKSNTDPESKDSGGGHRSRPRLPSAEDAASMDYGESSSDQSPKRPKPGTLKKRSFSTGSLDVSSEIMDETRDEHGHRKGGLTKSKSGKEGTRGFFGHKSQKSKSSKSSKWARVKKVLTGQKLYEDLGFSFKFGKGTHVRYHSVGSPQELSPPSHRVMDGRSLDSGVSSSLDVDGHPRTSTSSAEPPSPSKSPNQTEDRELDLTTDIWMGPQDWIDQHESRKESGASQMSEEVNTIIELKSVKEGEQFLKVIPLPRRQSSPTLGESQDEDMDATDAGRLRRSSSYKGTESDSTLKDDDASTTKSSDRDSKKLHKTPWGRVKDMIHTRKDSLKKKKKGDLDVSECSEADAEALDEHLRSDQFGEGVMSRSTPRTSPIAIRQRGSKSCSESPPTLGVGKTSPTRPSLPSGSPGDMAALLATGVSDEYIKKLQEWETLKTRKSLSSQKAVMEESNVTSPDSSFLSQDSTATDRSKARGSSPHRPHSRDSSGEESVDDITPADVSPSVNVDDLQRRITESFSRKLQEWERIKYRRETKEGSPEIERKGSKSRKDERQKSKKSREEKEKEKMEKQRERDLQKVEREQVKLEKEKMRLEKERLRALEREAKLEKMKGRLSQSDESSFRNPIISPMAEYKVTADFARKLHEWEVMKGLSHDISTAIYLEAQKRSLQQSREAQETATVKSEPQTSPTGGATGGAGQGARPKSSKPPPLTLQPYWDSPEETSPIEKSSETSVGDDTSITEEGTTIMKSNIASVDSFDSLERANLQLLEELQRKELEYAAIQEEVLDLNEKLSLVRDEHSTEMGTGALHIFSRYRKQLSSGGGTPQAVKLEVGALEATVADLEQKIKQLDGVGEKLAESMETAAVGKWQSIEGEELVSIQLMELVEQMRVMLLQASQSREASQKSSALHNFEKLYSQAMQLQVQMNNLRLSHLQRNKEIMDIKRQLLLQEVNNLLLQADITRRESELYQYQESRHPATVKRWNTFGGADRGVRVVEGREADRPPLQRFMSLKESEVTSSDDSSQPPEKRDSIPSKTALETRKQEKVREPIERQPADGVVSVSSADRDRIHSKSVLEQDEQTTDNVEKHLQTTKGSDKTPLERKASIHDDNLEVVCTLSLPTALVSLPKDISKTELNVPKVEKGSPTLETCVAKQPVSRTSEGAASSQSQQVTETPDEPIPERLRGLDKPRLVKSAKIIDDEYSPTETVMKCTEMPTSVESYKVESGPVHKTTQDVDITVHGKPAQSPKIKSQHPARARDAPHRETEDSGSTSPKSESGATAAKPPLPPFTQSTPVSTHSPRPRAYLDPEVRSHSAGEISHQSGGDDKPLSDMIKKFEKRATVCETAQHTFELRKTPSPTLYLPQVGLVSPVRRLKPAAELLKESQRYRSGHTVYSARLRQRYLKEEEGRQQQQERAKSHDKENISASYVQTMVQRLSREGTPTKSVDSSKNNSSLSLQRSDSPRTQSEFVSHIVRKLSSPSGPEHKFIVPLKDVTNDGQVKKLAEVFDTSPSPKSSPERTFSDSEVREYRKREKSRVPPSQRRSCELGALHDPSSVISSDSSLKPDSTISPTNHQSMPLLFGTERQASLECAQRDRSATYSASEQTQSKTGKKPEHDDEITVVSQETLSSSSSQQASASLSPTHGEQPAFPKSPRSGHKVDFSKLPSPKLHKRSEGGKKKKMGTIGVLCQQSMSFDLGVTLHAVEPESQTKGVVFRKSKRSDSTSPPASQRFSSTSSEGEGAPASPTDDKKRSRRLLDSSWLHKPKKFFKVSKC
ncbi:calponin homology domain-containing protein DDB_G0272472-like isoform X1 [Haliotis rufescens]|uniref:calponin homology domain-containing protein DDB_G0272472-like isoform X1 n=2 Tax=Haliotis rufescens TaxID=6454 RepID=UPI00201EFFCB|nr:calponin homology domain-containing protein DDB_G0272472-like isoform X1 [Haliotis rufescens]